MLVSKGRKLVFKDRGHKRLTELMMKPQPHTQVCKVDMAHQVSHDLTHFVENIRIKSEGYYSHELSAPKMGSYVFAYTISITNASLHPIQVLARHWEITNANGQNLAVEGEGVVGRQPIIQPGKNFCYSSSVEISTGRGLLEGRFKITDLQSKFDVWVPCPHIVLQSDLIPAVGYLN